MATTDPLETDWWQDFNPGIPHNPGFPEKLNKGVVIHLCYIHKIYNVQHIIYNMSHDTQWQQNKEVTRNLATVLPADKKNNAENNF